MHLSVMDQSRYPHSHRYIATSLPSVVGIAEITIAMLRHGGFTPAQLGGALNYGTAPCIRPDPLLDPWLVCGETEMLSDEIRVAAALFARYEQTRLGGDAVKLGVTILHEIVHWGNMRRGIQRTYEEGNRFEQEAYGRLIPCT